VASRGSGIPTCEWFSRDAVGTISCSFLHQRADGRTPCSCDQIHSKFPNASIHRSKIPPSSRMREEGDIVWVTSVVPEQNPAHPALQEGVSANVRDYHRHNGVTTFSSMRPYMVDPTETDAVLTWTEKTILTGGWWSAKKISRDRG
jgi:hypothetical protein